MELNTPCYTTSTIVLTYSNSNMIANKEPSARLPPIKQSSCESLDTSEAIIIIISSSISISITIICLLLLSLSLWL